MTCAVCDVSVKEAVDRKATGQNGSVCVCLRTVPGGTAGAAVVCVLRP